MSHKCYKLAIRKFRIVLWEVVCDNCVVESHCGYSQCLNNNKLLRDSKMRPCKLKNYLFGVIVLFLCISVAGAYEIGRCKVKVNPDGPVLRFAWLYYQDSSGKQNIMSTLPMQLFQQNTKVDGVDRDITICGSHTHSCDMYSATNTQNSDGAATTNDMPLGKTKPVKMNTKLVKMGNREDRVLFEHREDGTWRYTLKINGDNPSNNLEQEGIIASKAGDVKSSNEVLK
jgi:hypothetical protein